MASGGSPYSSLLNAFWKASKMPMPRGAEINRDDGVGWCAAAIGENASTNNSDDAAADNTAVKTRRYVEVMVMV